MMKLGQSHELEAKKNAPIDALFTRGS